MLEMLNPADVRMNPDVAKELNDKSTRNKIMEYMALGKPIVQFDLTEGWFSPQDASLYARRDDVVDMAEKIIELLGDPARRARMMEFGRRRIENELEWRYEAPRTAGSLRGPVRQHCGKRPHACNRPLIVFSKPDQLMIGVREP
jgi:hypothetical protein